MAKNIKIKTTEAIDLRVVPGRTYQLLTGESVRYPSLFYRHADVFGESGEWQFVVEMNEDETRALAAALLKSLEK